MNFVLYKDSSQLDIYTRYKEDREGLA